MEKFYQKDIESGESLDDEYTDEEIFRMYFENLDLKPEDFDKEILDIGSGKTQFAKWAKEHHVASNIYSVDISQTPLFSEKFAHAKVEKLPFADESFDLIISHAAIPQKFSIIKDNAQRQGSIKQAILEMLRVVRPGGQIKLAPMQLKNLRSYKKQVLLKRDFLKELNDIKEKYEFNVEKKKIGNDSLLIILNKHYY